MGMGWLGVEPLTVPLTVCRLPRMSDEDRWGRLGDALAEEESSCGVGRSVDVDWAMGIRKEGKKEEQKSERDRDRQTNRKKEEDTQLCLLPLLRQG